VRRAQALHGTRDHQTPPRRSDEGDAHGRERPVRTPPDSPAAVCERAERLLARLQAIRSGQDDAGYGRVSALADRLATLQAELEVATGLRPGPAQAADLAVARRSLNESLVVLLDLFGRLR
jgi:hypothetical protein